MLPISDSAQNSLNNVIKSTNHACKKTLKVYSASEHALHFDANEYLQAFYYNPREDAAMRTVLFFLPGIIYWIPEKIRTVLDLGAGPTVHVPITFRKHAEHIYSADYAQVNCDVLKNWAKNKSTFEWNQVCELIACVEDSDDSPADMQDCARNKFRAIFRIDLLQESCIKYIHYNHSEGHNIPQQFHVVVSLFCFEYSSENVEDYSRAVRNAVKLIEPNGFLIQGGVLRENDYYFGDQKYRCHYLTKEQIIESLKENNMTTEKGQNYKWFEVDDVFLLITKKKD
ncbi:unnamed protein product [Thelazia callipaeda]|uniref:NNMT/PNMT/TEMT family protein n=1 Tax=Thelazia callipaeda TaxID=103827 RepID=A0A0N5D6S7_THECL|nr:unnamed protein product [Thelazia callipaeda]